MEKKLEILNSLWYNQIQRRINYVSNLFNARNWRYRKLYWFNETKFENGKNLWFQENKNILSHRLRRLQRIGSTNSGSAERAKQTSLKPRIYKVVLDSSIYINAAISPNGNSGNVIKLACKGKIEIYISDYILAETIENLRAKATERDCTKHNRNITLIHPKNISPQDKLIETYKGFISPDDAPILALASFINADYLVTLNTKHFLNNPNLEILDLPFQITTPGDFIVKLGGEIVKR